jgi:hypothetical protein
VKTELAISFCIMAASVVIHVAGMIAIAFLFRAKEGALEIPPGLMRSNLILAFAFGLIIVLHSVETAIWAVFYQWWGLFPDYETSLYFSLGSYSTIGYGDIVLPQKWRLLGGMEGITGSLLVGLSTAFIFVIVNNLFQHRLKQKQL